MSHVQLHGKAISSLRGLSSKNPTSHTALVTGLLELEQKGLSASHIKNIGSDVYRKRVGRRRILFTINVDVFHVWIVDKEKDMKKDYKKWKKYIVDSLKMIK